MKFLKLEKTNESNPYARLSIFGEYKVNSFKSWLMLEMRAEIVQGLNSWQEENPDALPFHSLFGKDTSSEGQMTRIIIPFQSDPIVTDIINRIKSLNLTIDFNTGLVTDGKRSTKLGKYILDKKSQFTPQEKEWWIRSGNPISEIKAIQEKNKYTIIVSRNPIDIARMSDHDGWTSCHAPSREYFKCALSDAKGSGAIAYVVSNEDLKKIENLQKPEIFEDTDRKIKGVNPLSRIRLRKFIHKKEEYDLAVPENRTYGKIFPGLAESVRTWALKNQQDKLKGERLRLKDFYVTGGKYQDTSASDLFNYFFKDELDSGDAQYENEDEDQISMIDQYEQEVAQIEREFINKFHICSFHAEVEAMDGDDNHPYVMYGGWIFVEIPKELMLPEGKETDEYDVLKHIREWARQNNIYHINDLNFEYNEVRISIDDNNSNNDPDSFRGFLENTLKDIDDDKQRLESSLYQLFIELGLARDNSASHIGNNLEEHQIQLKNFDLDYDDDSHEISIKLKDPIKLDEVMLGLKKEQMDKMQKMLTIVISKIRSKLINDLNVWADRVHENKKKQLPLFQQVEFQPDYKRPFSGEFSINPLIEFPNLYHNDYIEIRMSITIKPFAKDEHVDDAMDFVRFIDDNYEKFLKLVYDIVNIYADGLKILSKIS